MGEGGLFKGTRGNFGDYGKVFYLDYGGGYTPVSFVKTH